MQSQHDSAAEHSALASSAVTPRQRSNSTASLASRLSMLMDGPGAPTPASIASAAAGARASPTNSGLQAADASSLSDRLSLPGRGRSASSASRQSHEGAAGAPGESPQVAAKSAEIESLTNMLQDERARYAELERNFRAMQGQAQQQITDLEMDLRSKTREIELLRADVDDSRQRLVEAREEVEAMKSKVVKDASSGGAKRLLARSHRRTLSSETGGPPPAGSSSTSGSNPSMSLLSPASSSSSLVDDAARERERQLQADVARLEGELRQARLEHSLEVGKLQDELETNRTRLQGALADNDASQEQLQAVRELIMGNSHELFGPNFDLAQLQEEHDLQQEEIEEYEGMLADALRELETLRAQVARNTKEQDFLDGTLADYEEENKMQETELAKLREYKAEASRILSMHDRELEAATLRGNELEKELTTLKDERSDMKKELSELRKEVTEKRKVCWIACFHFFFVFCVCGVFNLCLCPRHPAPRTGQDGEERAADAGRGADPAVGGATGREGGGSGAASDPGRAQGP